MRLIVLRMLATNSLSAFSTSVTTGRLDAGGAVQKARTLQPSPPAAAPGTSPTLALKPDAQIPAGRSLPRGSLLNLSV